MDRLARYYSPAVATLALVVALTTGGAWAVTQLGRNSVGGRQLRSNSVGSAEIRKGAVHSGELATGAVRRRDLRRSAVGAGEIATAAVGSTEIAPNSVQSTALALPEPVLLQTDATQVADVSSSYERVDVAGQVDKADATSGVRVDWSGVAQAGFLPCVFQLRVDGLPGGRGSEVYVPNGETASVSVESLFSGLPVGVHQVEVWARTVGGGSYPCTLNPAGPGVTQTVVVEEIVS